jgi:membrane protein required for colicin V production
MVAELALTPVDFVVIAVVLISALFAFVRGFVQEVLSVSGWIGAGFATYYGFGPAAPILRQYIDIAGLADVLTGVAIFVVVLVTLSFISHAIGRRVRGSSVGALDRSLGFLFGIARGAVLVIAAYMFADWAVPRDEQPEWWRAARVAPYADRGSQIVGGLLPGTVRNQGAELVDDLGARLEEGIRERTTEEIAEGITGHADSEDKLGYKSGERKALELILRNSGDE